MTAFSAVTVKYARVSSAHSKVLVVAVAFQSHILTCENGLYEYNNTDCITAETCEGYNNDHHPFRDLGRCVKAKLSGGETLSQWNN